MRKDYMLKKLFLAVRDCYKAFRKTPEPRLVMTLLVKDEEDILEDNLIFHRLMGVDGFIVTDNNSADHTPDIIRKYCRKGWILETIEESGNGFDRKAWTDRMVWKARTTYGADWVINADADELWYAPSGDLKRELRNTDANVLACDMRNVYPEEEKPFCFWDKLTHFVPNPFDYNLSPFSIFGPLEKKVIHRTSGYIQVTPDGHGVIMFPRRTVKSAVRIYHYTVRGKQHFIHKVVNVGSQLANHKEKRDVLHWRYFYNLYRRGVLEEHYVQVIGKEFYKELCEDHYIMRDTTIPRFYSDKMEERIPEP